MSSGIRMTYLFRSVLFSALTVTALMYGLAVYYGLSTAQYTYAGKEFRYLAEQAGQGIRNTFTHNARALSYLAERYATEFPHEEVWPRVLLPGFVKDLPYLRDTTGFETLLFIPLIRWEDIDRTDHFLMDAWAADPLVPPNAGLLPLPGIYGVPVSDRTLYYKDTTQVDWPAQYEVVMPIAQMLFDSDLPAYLLGRDMHANSDYGPGLENLMRCTTASNFSYARDNCGHVSQLDYADPADIHEGSVVQSNFVVPIMLGQNSSRLVGMMAGHFQWGKFLSGLYPEHVSGIDIVLRTPDTVVTFGLDKGQATFRSTGDTHGDRYAEFKFVMADVAISGSDAFTLEFYPQQKFLDERTDDSPIYMAVGAGLLILLCTFLFCLYDVPMQNEAIHTEAVLDTKRRFVRFISHEIRTPLNTVNMGLTLFGLELDTMRDAVVQIAGAGHGPGQEQEQSGAQPSALEV
eukprot:CAMPEP_0173176626 /NCGR_PEP_ID=MMETSP1141-20130122/4568_1 /TAXON_ID=483371 /ORGANISM="non described non described, Strain CCMP2298" /LENGTH=459 /DNA_ID=CAMNT_0014098993 /DNA_START=316 /DNA_END=1691 /DNA_ORIENTATION=-